MSEVSHAIGLKAEMTSRTQILTAKQYKSLKSIPRSQVVRIIDGDDELKITTMSQKIAAIAPRLLIKQTNKKLTPLRLEKYFKQAVQSKLRK